MLFVLLYRRVRYGYAFRRIPLTKGKYAIVDPDDYERLIKYRWCAVRGRDTFYAVRWGSRKRGERRKCYQMHREIIEVGAGQLCDHIDGNGLDNRKANLRAVTCAQNRWNSGKSRGAGRSKYKGLAWDSRDRRWEVRISVNGKRKYIGRFKGEMEAARAYDGAAVKYHGRYASLNFER
ncbi:MAG: AP2/ERF family transcription factor [Planctomycetota bacterium]